MTHIPIAPPPPLPCVNNAFSSWQSMISSQNGLPGIDHLLCTVLYCIALYCTGLYRTALYRTVCQIHVTVAFQRLRLCVQAIDTLALNLQNRWVFPPCLSFAKEAIQSGDPNTRAAGCTVLVVCAEGCCDACTTHLAEVLQVNSSPSPPPPPLMPLLPFFYSPHLSSSVK